MSVVSRAGKQGYVLGSTAYSILLADMAALCVCVCVCVECFLRSTRTRLRIFLWVTSSLPRKSSST